MKQQLSVVALTMILGCEGELDADATASEPWPHHLVDVEPGPDSPQVQAIRMEVQDSSCGRAWLELEVDYHDPQDDIDDGIILMRVENLDTGGIQTYDYEIGSGVTKTDGETLVSEVPSITAGDAHLLQLILVDVEGNPSVLAEEWVD